MSQRRWPWRWLVVAVGVAVLASTPGIVAAWRVSAAAMPVDQLYARMAASASQPYQGFAVSTGTGGLPTLPELADAIALLNGETQLRVWYASPERWRVDQIGVGTEKDLYQQRGDQVVWDFGTNQIATIVGAQPVRLPQGADLVPPVAAREIISLIGPRPALTALPARRVAGIAAAGLRITPADPLTLVGQVDMWADPATGLPLQVEITGRGAVAPILVTRFLDISFTDPDAAVLVPPVGGPTTAHVYTAGSDITQAFRPLFAGALPSSLGGFARTDDPAASVGIGAYGSGLTRFLVIPLPEQAYNDAYDRMSKAGGKLVSITGPTKVLQVTLNPNGGLSVTGELDVEGTVGTGIVVTTQLLTAFVTMVYPARHAYLLVGLVTASVLASAGHDLAAFAAQTP